jgi:hypothetical protein
MDWQLGVVAKQSSTITRHGLAIGLTGAVTAD